MKLLTEVSVFCCSPVYSLQERQHIPTSIPLHMELSWQDTERQPTSSGCTIQTVGWKTTVTSKTVTSRMMSVTKVTTSSLSTGLTTLLPFMPGLFRASVQPHRTELSCSSIIHFTAEKFLCVIWNPPYTPGPFICIVMRVACLHCHRIICLLVYFLFIFVHV